MKIIKRIAFAIEAMIESFKEIFTNFAMFAFVIVYCLLVLAAMIDIAAWAKSGFTVLNIGAFLESGFDTDIIMHGMAQAAAATIEIKIAIVALHIAASVFSYAVVLNSFYKGKFKLSYGLDGFRDFLFIVMVALAIASNLYVPNKLFAIALNLLFSFGAVIALKTDLNFEGTLKKALEVVTSKFIEIITGYLTLIVIAGVLGAVVGMGLRPNMRLVSGGVALIGMVASFSSLIFYVKVCRAAKVKMN